MRVCLLSLARKPEQRDKSQKIQRRPTTCHLFICVQYTMGTIMHAHLNLHLFKCKTREIRCANVPTHLQLSHTETWCRIIKPAAERLLLPVCRTGPFMMRLVVWVVCVFV